MGFDVVPQQFGGFTSAVLPIAYDCRQRGGRLQIARTGCFGLFLGRGFFGRHFLSCRFFRGYFFSRCTARAAPREDFAVSARGKFKHHLAFRVAPGQHGFKGAACAHRDEVLQLIGLACGQQLLHLFAFNWLLQNDFAAFEVATGFGLLGCGHGFFADEMRAGFKHAAATNRTGSQAILRRKVL